MTGAFILRAETTADDRCDLMEQILGFAIDRRTFLGRKCHSWEWEVEMFSWAVRTKNKLNGIIGVTASVREK